VVDPDEVPWIVADGLSRDLLRETLKEIEADLTAWLDQTERHGLRAWMLERLPDPPVLDGRAEPRKRPVPPSEPAWEGGDDLFVAIDENAAPDLAAVGADRP
jgi:hypothetical protein